MQSNEIDAIERIDRRDVRALTEVMSVLDDHDPRVAGADDLYLVVSGSGREYLVDVRQGACECPDFEHNLPTADGRQTCKHLARVTYETGMRPIPAWVDRDALDDQIGVHVDATPRMNAAAVAADGGDDTDQPAAQDRPADCCCIDGHDLPCWMCWRAGFRENAYTAAAADQ